MATKSVKAFVIAIVRVVLCRRKHHILFCDAFSPSLERGSLFAMGRILTWALLWYVVGAVAVGPLTNPECRDELELLLEVGIGAKTFRTLRRDALKWYFPGRELKRAVRTNAARGATQRLARLPSILLNPC